MRESSDPRPDDAGDFDGLISGVLDDDREATDRLCRALETPVRNAVGRFLGPDGGDSDDIVQDSILAVLFHLRRRAEFHGDLVRFAVTIANNRCRDLFRARQRRPHVPIEPLADWIADRSHSPLDHLEEAEILAIMHQAVADLGPECRDLLRAIFLEGATVETMRKRFGLKTVQGIYHRRAICLKNAFLLLKRRLSDRSLHGT